MNKEDFVNACSLRYKGLLNESKFVEPSKQVVYRKVLLQGVVIALRHYLSARMRRFLPLIEVSDRRGRPFRLFKRCPAK